MTTPFTSLAWLVIDDPGPILRLRARHVDVALSRCEEPQRIYEAIVDGPARLIVSFADASYIAAWCNAETGEDCMHHEPVEPMTSAAPGSHAVWGLHATVGERVDQIAHRAAVVTLASMPHDRIGVHLHNGTIGECVTLPEQPRIAAYFFARYIHEVRGFLVGLAHPCRVEA